MNLRGSIVFSIALTSSVWADQVVLKDGDRLTGSIVKKDGDALTIESKNFGLVKLKWDQVESIRTDQPLNVVLPGDRTIKADVRTENERIQISAPGERQTVAPGEIVALRNEAEQRSYERFLHPGPLDLWAVTGSLNIAGAKGNAETSTLTTPINFVRTTNTSRTTAYFNLIRSTATIDGAEAQTAKAVRGGWGFNRNLSKKVFANVFNDYEYDRFQSLDLRVVLGGGLGYTVWAGETGRLAALAGAAWNRESFSPFNRNSFTRNSAEAYWGNEFGLKLGARTNLVQAFRMFNNLTSTGEYRINFDVVSITLLTRWLTWNISLSDRYLSNPVAGRKNNDLLYTTGLGFTFSR